MQRSKRHVVVGLTFVGTAFLAAGMLYVGVKMGSNAAQAVDSQENAAALNNVEANEVQANDVADTTEASADEAPIENQSPSISRDSLVGVVSSQTTEEGKCLGQVLVFSRDGTFVSGTYPGPEAVVGKWAIEGSRLLLTQGEKRQDGIEGSTHLADASLPLEVYEGVTVINGTTFTRCTIDDAG